MVVIRHSAWFLGSFFLLAALSLGGCSSSSSPESNYLLGAGSADITGPIVDVPFVGYSQPTHIANGIHTRLSARAFIIGERAGDARLVFVVTDLLNVSQEIRLSVVENLQESYGDLYSVDNVVVTATHTHSSPGGYRHDGAYRQEFFDAVVAGVTEAIEAAHEDLQPGRILLGEGEVEGAGANRSIVAYERNPEDERTRYPNDTDKEMLLLKLERDDGVVGVLSWFAVHPTSLTFNNSLVSADHKGFAANEMERQLRARADMRDDVVVAFAQSNCGDVTGNLNLDNTGPGEDDYESAAIIGQRQLDAAMDLFESASEPLSHGVDHRFTLVDLTDLEVSDEFTGSGAKRTCFPAYGYSYAGGSTEDGGGHPIFEEGMLEEDEGIETLVQLVVMPPPVTDEMRACQAPKPVLFPKRAQPPLPVGVARLGQLALVFVPNEVTTMSGRRMRDTIREQLGDEVKHVVIAGYANDYAGYITTPEEYTVQHYEGGHTLFGQWTLPAYQQVLAQLAQALAEGSPAPESEPQSDLRGEVESQGVGNAHDEPPESGAFGDVTTQPEASYTAGDTVSASFWTGHPDNAPLRGAPYFEIQREVGAEWATAVTEADWSTQARWTQASRVIPPYDPLDPFAVPPPPINEAFTVSIDWDTPDELQAGNYRVVLYGHHKPDGEDLSAFTAATNAFEIAAP